MKIRRYCLALPLVLAACTTVTEFGGAGQTAKGMPVSGLLAFDHASRIFHVELDSPSGWSCTADFKQSGQNMQKRAVPLICNDGRSGTLILTNNQIQGQAVGSFSLTGGEAGHVTFGRL